MHRDRQCIAAQIERRRGARIVGLVRTLGQEFLQLLEQSALAGALGFLTQAVHCGIEHGDRPLAFEFGFGRRGSSNRRIAGVGR